MGILDEQGKRRTSTSHLPVPILSGLLQPRPAPRQLLSKAQRLGTETEIRTKGVLGPPALLPTGTGPIGAIPSHSLSLDPAPSLYLSLAAQCEEVHPYSSP